MSIFNIACAALGGAASSPNIITVPDGEISFMASAGTAGIQFKNNGSYALYYDGTPIVDGYWITPQTNISQYEIYATKDSGTTPTTGTLTTWQALSTTRSWTLTSLSSDVTCDLTFQIRWTGDNSVQDTGTVTLTVLGSIPP